MIDLYAAGCAAILAGGVCSLFFRGGARGAVYAVFSAAGLACLAPAALSVLLGGGTPSLAITLPFPVGPVRLELDPLSAFFILILALSNFTAALYSTGYLKAYRDAPQARLYCAGLAALFVSMLLLAAVRQAAAFLILWEIMSLASFALTAFEHEKEETRKAAVYYLVAMQAGFAFLLAGFLVLGNAAGSTDFTAFSSVLSAPGALAIGIFLLFFAGFAVKAGFFPFHTWLPRAHPAAPAPVSAVMSGVMIKTGIYGLLRLILLTGTPPLALSALVTALALATAVWGGIQAVTHGDLKKVLASSSMENMGLIGAGVGLGMLGLSLKIPAMAFLGFLGGLLHVFNHSLFKSLLFMGAGSVYMRTHTRDMGRLGGLAKAMPATTALFLLGSLAICGLPPLVGFAGEFAMYLAAVRGLVRPDAGLAVALALCLALLAFTGALALAAFVRAFGLTFLGLPRASLPRPPREAEPVMLAAQAVPAALIVGLGLFPQAALPFMTRLLTLFVGPAAPSLAAGTAGLFGSLSTAFLVFAGIAGGLLALRALLLRRRAVTETKTWDCGYQSGSGRLQYTPGSFSSAVRGFFAPLLGFKVKVETKPAVAVSTETADPIDRFGVGLAARGARKFFGIFQWVQSGNTRQYILYGVVFLVAVIVFIFGLGG